MVSGLRNQNKHSSVNSQVEELKANEEAANVQRETLKDHQKYCSRPPKKCDLCCYSNIHCNFLDLNNTKLVYINCPVSDFKTLWKNKQNCAETFLCFFFVIFKQVEKLHLKLLKTIYLIYSHLLSFHFCGVSKMLNSDRVYLHLHLKYITKMRRKKKECDQVFSLFSHCWLSVFVPLLKATASYRTQAAGHKNELIQQ